MSKYHKLSRKTRELRQPPEKRLIHLAALALTTFLVTFLSISILTPPQPSSASTSSSSTLTANISATNYYLTLSSTTPTLNINATPGGTLTAATDTVSVKTNNPNGYKLYLSMSSASNRLYLNGDSATGKYFSPTSGTFTNPKKLDTNSWGYALAKSDAAAVLAALSLTPTTTFSDVYSSTPDSDSTWAAVPVKASSQLIKSTSGADESGTSTSVYYAASANVGQPSGSYSGTILYTAIANTGSTSDSATVSPTSLDASIANQSVTITTSLYANAELIGDVTVSLSNASTPATSCPVTAKSTDPATSRVQITCTAPALSAGTYSVNVNIPFYDKTYAIADGVTYVQRSLYELANGKNLQNLTTAVCSAAKQDTAGTFTGATMTDARDDQTYRVAKLPDDNCWLVDNLRLGTTIKNSGSIQINSTTSDYSGTAFNITSSNVMASGKTNNWTDEGIDTLHIYAREATEKDSNGNPYGNLYNWYTSTAKSGTQDITSTSVNSSLCPKNWQLPSNTGKSSYATLFQAALSLNGTEGTDATLFGASATITKAPYFFPLSGYWHAGGLQNVNFHDAHWTNSATQTNTHSYGFNFYSEGQYNFHYANYKANGLTVRCVLSNS